MPGLSASTHVHLDDNRCIEAAALKGSSGQHFAIVISPSVASAMAAWQ